MLVRNYTSTDYSALKSLYEQGGLYGGQFDPDRDSSERIDSLSGKDPESILVCEDGGRVIGTVSLIENGRVAWLFRFAVQNDATGPQALKALYGAAVTILKQRGHSQVLVYSPVGNTELGARYGQGLGFTKGNDYTCFWKEI